MLETLRIPDAAESSPTAVLETVHVEDLPAAGEPEPEVTEAEGEAPVTGDPYTTAALPVCG